MSTDWISGDEMTVSLGLLVSLGVLNGYGIQGCGRVQWAPE